MLVGAIMTFVAKLVAAGKELVITDYFGAG